jgi:hypothetical protein
MSVTYTAMLPVRQEAVEVLANERARLGRGVARVGAGDNFFDLGANSLHTTQLVAQWRFFK